MDPDGVTEADGDAAVEGSRATAADRVMAADGATVEARVTVAVGIIDTVAAAGERTPRDQEVQTVLRIGWDSPLSESLDFETSKAGSSFSVG